MTWFFMFPKQIIWSRGYGCDLKDCARLKQTLEKEEHGIQKVLIGLNKFSNKMFFVWVGNHKLRLGITSLTKSTMK
jgi:hypothetical protein